ncbi:type VII secretion-associated serine protease mycosin [Micromonospora zhanjiangensis]|uniref:Type VII secretion-associated serine protease mycosin n=1 Tax=Micromonospora zhanjiangensis TaxID=1522057 RepID=A0ABV8KND3_9ACTN
MTQKFPTRSAGRTLIAALTALTAVTIAAPPALADATRDAQWHLKFLKVAEAHRITQGAGVTVAVIDTGVDATHPDLIGSVLPGKDFSIRKADVPDGRTDTAGHGTAMAGLIAAHGHGNGAGALGIAPAAKILPVRYHSTIEGMSQDTPAAIRWAVAQGAKVISMSFGGENEIELQEAILAARRADVVLVAATGNRPRDRQVGYPAAYDGVLAVGGVDRNGNHADISVTGPQTAISAPAVDTLSTDTRANGGSGYSTETGTSGATAIVAGAAALVRAKYPTLSAPEVIHRLTATATDKGAPGRDPEYGYGVLNLVAALTADVPPIPAVSKQPVPDPDATFTRPGPAPNAQPDGGSRQWPIGGLVALGAGCLLFVAAVVGGGIWLIRRNRRT